MNQKYINFRLQSGTHSTHTAPLSPHCVALRRNIYGAYGKSKHKNVACNVDKYLELVRPQMLLYVQGTTNVKLCGVVVAVCTCVCVRNCTMYTMYYTHHKYYWFCLGKSSNAGITVPHTIHNVCTISVFNFGYVCVSVCGCMRHKLKMGKKWSRRSLERVRESTIARHRTHSAQYPYTSPFQPAQPDDRVDILYCTISLSVIWEVRMYEMPETAAESRALPRPKNRKKSIP